MLSYKVKMSDKGSFRGGKTLMQTICYRPSSVAYEKVPPKLTLQSKKLLFLPEQRRHTKVPKVIEAHLGVLLAQSAQI